MADKVQILETGDLLQDHPKVSRDGNPTPDERADFVMKRLEQFIRDGRRVGEGMPLRQWQEMARGEIANAILEADLDRKDDTFVTKRLLFTLASSITTIGFWGALWSYDQVIYFASALVCLIAGIIMLAVSAEWGIRRTMKRHRMETRAASIKRVENLTRRIRKMEKQIVEEAKRIEEEMAELGLEFKD